MDEGPKSPRTPEASAPTSEADVEACGPSTREFPSGLALRRLGSRPRAKGSPSPSRGSSAPAQRDAEAGSADPRQTVADGQGTILGVLQRMLRFIETTDQDGAGARELVFVSEQDEVIAAVPLEGRRVGFGVRIDRQLYVDTALSAEAEGLGQVITRWASAEAGGSGAAGVESLQLDLSVAERRALCGLTARALLEVLRRVSREPARVEVQPRRRPPEVMLSFSGLELQLSLGGRVDDEPRDVALESFRRWCDEQGAWLTLRLSDGRLFPRAPLTGPDPDEPQWDAVLGFVHEVLSTRSRVLAVAPGADLWTLIDGDATWVVVVGSARVAVLRTRTQDAGRILQPLTRRLAQAAP